MCLANLESINYLRRLWCTVSYDDPANYLLMSVEDLSANWIDLWSLTMAMAWYNQLIAIYSSSITG